MNPIRKPTFAGRIQSYEFDGIEVRRFLVKNLSGGDVYVALSNTAFDGTAETWLIPDGAWQVIPGTERQSYRRVYVKAVETSATDRGVEIEAVDYKLASRMEE